MIVVLMNLVLLLNLVIAILSDTYSKFSAQSRGLFYDGMVSAISSYNYDKFYGGMIIATPPINLLVLPFLPIFWYSNDMRKIKRVNDIVCEVVFFPMAIVFLSFFTAVDILLAPFAYIYSLIHKIKLVFMPKTYRSKRAIIADCFLFLFFGPAFILLNIPGDMYYFIRHIYSAEANKL